MLAGALLAACGSSPAGAPALAPSSTALPSSASPPAATATPPVIQTVFGRQLRNPEVAVTGGSVYVAWQVSPAGGVARSELARVDPASGRIEAARPLGAAFAQAISAGGALWVSVSGARDETLLRLSPQTLKLTGRRRIASTPSQGLAATAVAAAGGGLWAADGNRLLRLSLPGARITASITLPGAATSDLSADPAGTVLLVGEADSSGRGAVQRRDPATGAVLAAHPMLGVAAPVVAGPAGSAVWVSQPTGLLGYVQRLDATTLAAATARHCELQKSTNTCLTGTNAIMARIADGLLWVTQPAGWAGRNYCADPATGRPLAPIRLPRPDQDDLLAIGPHQIFYAAPGRTGSYLRQTPIPAGCGPAEPWLERAAARLGAASGAIRRPGRTPPCGR